MAQLDWLWSSRMNQKIPEKPETETTVAELSRHLDKDQMMDFGQQNDAKSKPIQK
jgi:hypothetical protein